MQQTDRQTGQLRITQCMLRSTTFGSALITTVLENDMYKQERLRFKAANNLIRRRHRESVVARQKEFKNLLNMNLFSR